MYTKFLKDDKGFTGLEAAIVLIAFVVVAAVFSYVMLGAGFFTTQKSQEVVHTGVTQASSSLSPSGDVIVTGGAAKATAITFYISNTAGGTAVDLDKTIITFTNNTSSVTADEDSAAWSYSVIISNGGASNLIESGEKYKIIMDLTATGFNAEPQANEKVEIQVKPPEGAVLTLDRTMPPALAASTYYTVY
ncbi:MAG: archaeal flagellin FlaB [Euryarchaeota archaeon]|nr:archaeal flagellin FlaB [Euryarchaeota archaeon]